MHRVNIETYFLKLDELLQNRINKQIESAKYFKENGFNRFIKDVSDSRWFLSFLLVAPFYLLIIIHSSRIAADTPITEFNGSYLGSCKTTVTSSGRGSPNKSTTLSISGNGIDLKFNLNEQPFLCGARITHFSTVSDSAIYINPKTYILDATYRKNYSYKTQTVTRSIEEINKNEIDSFNLFMTGSFIFSFLIFAIGMYLFSFTKHK